jgi:tagatose 6-phosphate kinase
LIATVTPNVALDKTYLLSGFNRQGVHRVELAALLPAGKGVNVARVLNQLQVPVICTGVVAGYTGQHICALLKEADVQHDFVWTRGESRQCLTLLEPGTDLHCEILEPGPAYTPELSRALIEKARRLARESDYVVIAGNPPPGTDPNLLKQLVQAARESCSRVVLDAHGIWLYHAIAARPHIIKPNWQEFQELTGPCPDNLAAVARAKPLLAAGIELVLISQGAAGALAVTLDCAWQITPPQVQAVSAVGCGDAMVGGLVASLTHKEPLQTALRFATAVATANTLVPGAGIFTHTDATRLYAEVQVEQLA